MPTSSRGLTMRRGQVQASVASLPAELIADITTIASPRHGWRGRGVSGLGCDGCSHLAGVHGCRGPQVAPYHPPSGGRGGLQGPLGPKPEGPARSVRLARVD